MTRPAPAAAPVPPPEPPLEPLAPAVNDTGQAASAALRAALVYAVCGALWILFSDRALAAWITDSGSFALASAVKGWAFVAVTAVLLYGLLRQRWSRGVAGVTRTAAGPAVPMRLAWRLALALSLTAGATAAAISYSMGRHRDIELAQLQAVADQKVQRLTDWVKARTADAEMLAAASDAATLLGRWQGGADRLSRDELVRRLEQLRPLTQFQAASLLDAQGHLLWRSLGAPPDDSGAGNATVQAERERIARQTQARLVGPYRDALGVPHTELIVPLAVPGPQPGQRAPLLLLHLDGSHYLPSSLNEWPTPSATGETVLARRDGDEVLYLGALRHATEAALRLRQPLADHRQLMAQLIEGAIKPGAALDGVGYSGSPAIGVGRAVPGTDWVLLAQMNKDELYGLAVSEAIWIVLSGALALFVMASGLYLARQRRELALSTQAQQAQQERLRALGLLAAIADSSDDAIFAMDPQGRYTLFNPAASRFVGKPAHEVIGCNNHDLFPPDQASLLQAAEQLVVAQDRLVTQEEALSTVDGERVFLATKGPLRDSSGRIVGIFGISRDITQIKQTEAALRRANRALLTSQECGQAVMRVADEDDLLREICRIVVHTGGYRMAWVGFAQDDALRTVHPVTHEGVDTDYLHSLQISWGDNPQGQGPTGAAIRERRPMVIRDVLRDPACDVWREWALRGSFVSAVALPLMPDSTSCIGALCIYSRDEKAFGDEEVRLVAELANDLAHGIRVLRDRKARLEAERLLREQKERLAESQRIASVGSWEIDWQTQALSWSDETWRLHGMQPGETALTLEVALRNVPPEEREAPRGWLRRLVAGLNPGDLEFHATLPDGSRRTLTARGALQRDATGQPWRVVGTVQDVTALRQAEAERLAQEARYHDLFAANPHPMWVFDSDTLAFLEVNDAAVSKYGYSRDEFMAMDIRQIRPDHDLPRLMAGLDQPHEGLASLGQWQHRLKSGEVIDVDISSHRLQFGGRPAVVALAHDVTAQKRTEARLRQQAQRAEALLDLPEQAELLGETEFMQRALAVAEDLTGSHIAFVHFVNDGDENLELVTWSRRTLERFCRAEHDRHYPVSQAGVWAEALRLRKAVMFNDYATYPHQRGLPEGHGALDKLIVVPVMEGGKAVMLCGVGGKASDYDELDVESVQLISNETWRLVQRRRAEAALLQSEARYRALTEQVPAIIYRAELDGASTTTYISPAVQGLGYTPQEWLQNPSAWIDNLHPADHDRVMQALQEAQATASGIDVQYRFRTRDGRWRHLHDKAELVRDGSGRPLHLQGLMLDVTEQVQAEDELRKLYQAVEQSPNSVVITNLEAEIEYVNQAFLSTTGYSREEVLGQNPRILQADEVKPGDRAGLWAALSRGQAWKGEFRNKRKDGSVYTELAHVAPLRQADGHVTHYVGVKEDITEVKRISGELERHRQHLEELVEERTRELVDAQRRAEAASRAKSAFLANMSHEIRTPMNAIVGLSHLLQRDPATPQQASWLAKIDAAALHLLSLINGILDLSKIEAGKLALETADFALASVLEPVKSLIADRALAKGVTMQVQVAGVPAWLHGDAVRLRQALLNYADNALKFTVQGRIGLHARLLAEDAQGLLVRFEVQDTGIGIEAAELPRLFQVFEQADASTTRRYGGTGLGLALTRHLAQLMGGETGVSSQPGVGSTFWFTARLQRGEADPPTQLDEVDAEAALSRLSGKARILVAEDDPVNREVATEMLRALGLQVDTADDGQQALLLAGRRHYDLVLMDVQMPVLDGFEATRALRQQPGGADLPILAMTANAFEEVRQACLAAGMDGFVAKPVDIRQLRAALLRWLPGRVSADTSSPIPATALGTPPEPDWLHPLASQLGLDVQRGLAAVGDDRAAFLRMLQHWVSAHRQDAETLDRQLCAGLWMEARQMAHRLRGAAGTVGATGLQEAAAALEEALREPLLPTAWQGPAERMLQQHRRLMQALAELPTPAPLNGDVDTLEPLPADLLSDMKRLIDSDDTAAIELFDVHRHALVARLGVAAARLEHQLGAFDFAAARDTLQQALDAETFGSN